MKKTFLISAAVISAIIILLSANSAAKMPAKNTSESSSQNEKREVLYVMRTYNEEIGVFKPLSDTPLYTLQDVHVKSLPSYDQSLLNSGIKIYSEKELQSRIEDYDS